MRLLKCALAAALAANCLTACSGEDQPAHRSLAQALDTKEVLAIAQMSSEADAPFQVNDGALTLTDTSETSASITINSNP